MTTLESFLPPQGCRTPRGRREGITVPGPLMSSSYDGLTTLLTPSNVAENTIGCHQLLEPRRRVPTRPPREPIIASHDPPLRLRGGGDEGDEDEQRRSSFRNKPGPACFKKALVAPLPKGDTGSEEESSDSSSTTANAAGKRAKKSEPSSRKRGRSDQDSSSPVVISSDSEVDLPSSSDRDGDPRGRKAKCKAHKGQFTKKARKEKAIAARMEKNSRLARLAKNPKIGVNRDTPAYCRYMDSVETLLREWRETPTGALKDDIMQGLQTIIKVAQKSSNLKGDLCKALYDASADIEASSRIIADRKKGGYLYPLAGRAPSPANGDTAAILEANRLLEEENAKLRAELEERNRVSLPPSPHYTRSRKIIRDESPPPSPMIVDEEDLAAHPAVRPPIQGVSKILEDPPNHQGVVD